MAGLVATAPEVGRLDFKVLQVARSQTSVLRSTRSTSRSTPLSAHRAFQHDGERGGFAGGEQRRQLLQLNQVLVAAEINLSV